MTLYLRSLTAHQALQHRFLSLEQIDTQLNRLFYLSSQTFSLHFELFRSPPLVCHIPIVMHATELLRSP